MAEVEAVPMRSPVLEPGKSGLMRREFVRFLDTLRRLIGLTAQQQGAVELTAQSAAIVTTDIPLPTVQEGLYRLSYSLRITQAATTMSSCGVTFGWVTNAISCSQVFDLLVGNTTASQTSDSITVSVDAASAITYAVSYSSTGATAMTYALDVRAEVLP